MDQKTHDYLTICRHLFQQGEQAINPTFACRYRIKGKKCAVGVLIPDDNYSPEMESKSIQALFAIWMKEDWVRSRLGHIPMLQALQRIHDNSEIWTNKTCMGLALDAVGIASGIDVSKCLSVQSTFTKNLDYISEHFQT